VVYVSDGDNPRASSGKRDQSHPNQAALIGMKFADETIKSRATCRSNDLELVGIGWFSGRKGGTAPGHEPIYLRTTGRTEFQVKLDR
jgi:hypothetical protein